MARTKVTVRRLPAKTRRLRAGLVNREYKTKQKKNSVSFQDKINITRTKNCEHYKERTSNKNNKWKKKSKIFNQ